MAGTAPQSHSFTTDEVRNISVDMSLFLDAGEVLTGTPQIQCSDDLTITDPQTNAAALMINGSLAAVATAIQFTIASTTPGKYFIELLCSTDAGQTVEGRIQVNVERSRY